MKKRFAVCLSEDHRTQLFDLIGKGTAEARVLTHARILLKADQRPGAPGWIDARIAEAVEVSQPTVFRVRRQFVADGLEAALHRGTPPATVAAGVPPQTRRRPGSPPDCPGVRYSTGWPCGTPPAGRAVLHRLAVRTGRYGCWPIAWSNWRSWRRSPSGDALLSDGASHPQKNALPPHLKRQWCIPPQANAEFVYRMEDVLAVSTRPYDPARPQVCRDEASKQVLRDTRAPLPMQPGQPARIDHEYERGGVVTRFLFCEPLVGTRFVGTRWVDVTEHRTKRDWASQIQHLVAVRYPDAERIVLVMDNLNVHGPASLSEAFAPAEAKRLTDKLEIHYTPKHGSWLTMAEIELSALSRQCAGRRFPDVATRIAEVTAGEAERNARTVTVDWRFTTDDARSKLTRLYPSLQE